ncbi:oxidoreductase [Fusarium coicis]|nr:oxidoreductase [Fusarium coicis]
MIGTAKTKPRVSLGLLTFGPEGLEAYGSRVLSLDTFNECLDYLQSRGYNEVDTDRTYVGVPFQETLEACNELYQEGMFKKLGLSNYAAREVAELCTIADQKGWAKPSVYQAMYNYLTRAIEEELIPCCRKFGMDILVYNPLAGGVLPGRDKSKEIPADGGRYFNDVSFEALKVIQPVADKLELTPLEIAFRWLLHHSKVQVMDGNDGLFIGISSLSQLESNLDNVEKVPLPEEVLEVLDEAWKITKPSCSPYWSNALRHENTHQQNNLLVICPAARSNPQETGRSIDHIFAVIEPIDTMIRAPALLILSLFGSALAVASPQFDQGAELRKSECDANVMPESVERQHTECQARNLDFTFDAEKVCGMKLDASSTSSASSAMSDVITTSNASHGSSATSAPASTTSDVETTSSTKSASRTSSTAQESSTGGAAPVTDSAPRLGASIGVLSMLFMVVGIVL